MDQWLARHPITGEHLLTVLHGQCMFMVNELGVRAASFLVALINHVVILRRLLEGC